MQSLCGFPGRDLGKDCMNIDKKRMKRQACLMAKGILDYLYPPRCPGCDRLLAQGQTICEDCSQKIRRAAEPVCKRCGKPMEYERREYCADCFGKEHKYRQGKAVFIYEGKIRQSMYRFKYSNKREYAAFYAAEAARLYKDWIRRKQIEVIVPIPMYQGKKRRRGYNQAEVFAKALGRELGMPVDTGLVRRVRDTTPQKELNDKERRCNLKNAFQLVPNIVKYKEILLVDDIYTTGSTMDAVAEVLLSAGVKNIYYICISIGIGY